MKEDRSPAIQFYFNKFTGDPEVSAMPLEAVGAHILLICYAGSSPEGYRIPCRNDADEYAIRMLARNPSDEAWQRIKAQLLRGAWKISDDGQWWEQDGLYKSLSKQKAFSEEQKKRADSRWAKEHAGRMPDGCPADTGVVPEGCSVSVSVSVKQEPGDETAPPNPPNQNAKVIRVSDSDTTDYSDWCLRTIKAHPLWKDETTMIPPYGLADQYEKAIKREAPAHGGELKTAEWMLAQTECYARIHKEAGTEDQMTPGIDKYFRNALYAQVIPPAVSHEPEYKQDEGVGEPLNEWKARVRTAAKQEAERKAGLRLRQRGGA